MLPPHELKNKTFSRVLRGYNSVEVDEHVNFIIEKYTELYRQNDELERKLKLAEAQLAEFRADEVSIRSALVNAQKASAKIIGEANERADVVMRSARTNCNKVIASFRGELQKERDELLTLRRAVAEFKARLFAQYQQHIGYIEEISPDIDESEAETPDDVFVRRVVNQVKNDIASGKVSVSSDMGEVNTAPGDEAIIQSYDPPARTEQKPQPAIREITRSRPTAEPPAYKPAEPEPAPDKPDGKDARLYNPAGETGAEKQAADQTGDGTDDGTDDDTADGGDDTLTVDDMDDSDSDDSSDSESPDTAEDNGVGEYDPEDGGPEYADAASEPDTVVFGSVKPGSRPSTIASADETEYPRTPANGNANGNKKAYKTSDTAELAQTGRHQNPQSAYRSASVKDTIRELNKKFASDDAEPENNGAAKPRGEEFTPDAEDEELLSMIRSVTGAAEEKERAGKDKKKNKTKPLSLTEEFDLITEDDEYPGDK